MDKPTSPKNIEFKSDNTATDEDGEGNEDLQRLDAFGSSLSKTRSEDISFRQASGIELRWVQDEEYYEGIDEYNREREGRSIERKPDSRSTNTRQVKQTRSEVFPNITGPFVDAGVGRLADVLLPPVSMPAWDLEPTPDPELIRISEAKAFEDEPEGVDFENEEELQEQAQLENAQLEEAKRQIQEAKDAAKRAKVWIHDRHVECGRNAQERLIIEDSGKVGVGVMKSPFPKVKERWAWIDGEMKHIKKTTPHSKRIDYWDLYPDKDCGEDIHSGAHIWEKDRLTKKEVRELLKDESYIAPQLMRCLVEGPMKATAEYQEVWKGGNSMSTDKYEIWYMHGTAEREDMVAAGCNCDGEEDPFMPVMVAMINNHVIKVSHNPMETGHFPYSVFRWRPRKHDWTGVGIARQVRVAQQIVIAGTRNLMDNAGLGAGPMIVFKQGQITPVDGIAKFAPRKIWTIAEDADGITDATKAIGVVKVDMLVDELMKIINFGMKLAEDTTGLPMLLQGQMGAAPDTVGGLKLLHNNTAAPLRRLARSYDAQITEPDLERYYIWCLLDGPDDAKGDFFIKATGSSTLVERDLQESELANMLPMVQPQFRMDPAKYAAEWLKSRRFDPANFQYEEDSEEWQQVVQAIIAPPPDTSVEVATIRAEADLQKAQMAQEGKRIETQLGAEMEIWKQGDVKNAADIDRQLKLILAGATEEGDIRKIGAVDVRDNKKIKAELAKLIMEIQATAKLAGMHASAKHLPKPPVEPPGRASPGHSYQE